MDWNLIKLSESSIADATDAYERGGTAGLSVDQRRVLVKMVIDDYRCAAALPTAAAPGPRPIPALLQVFRDTWCREPLMLVPDLRKRLLEAADSLGEADIPVARLVLLATWIEHTINVLMVRSAQHRGLPVAELDAFAEKVGNTFVVTRLHQWSHPAWPNNPPLSAQVLADLHKVFDARKDSAHFRWIGKDAATHEARLERLRDADLTARALVSTLTAIEVESSPRGRLDDARRYFAV